MSVFVLEAPWVVEPDETRYDRMRAWSNDWAWSVSSDFRSGVDAVRGFQRRRQTLYEVLIISVLIGVLGNILAQALFPYPVSDYNSTRTQLVNTLPTVGVVIAAMIILVWIFLRIQKRYGPREPAQIALSLDYPTLLKSYDKAARDDVEYLMGGTGVRDFADFGKRVLNGTLEHIEAIPLDCKISNVQDKIQSADEESLPDVSLSGDLREVATQYKMGSVHANLDLLLYASRQSSNPPARAHGVTLRITISVAHPSDSLADDFLIRIIEPLLPYIAKAFSYSFWAELVVLSPISQLRQLLKRVHEFRLSRGKTGGWYPMMNQYPYDGKSKYMIIVDRSLTKREGIRFSQDPLMDIIEPTVLFGCYVTDSDDWIALKDYRLLFHSSHHIVNELIYVRPDVVFTIGPKSKTCMNRMRKVFTVRARVVNVLENVKATKSPDFLRKSLSKALEKELKKL